MKSRRNLEYLKSNENGYYLLRGLLYNNQYQNKSISALTKSTEIQRMHF